MMKFHAAIATCLATYFVSGLSQDSQAVLVLSKQLRQTEHSLGVMNQLKERGDVDPASVSALLLSATEPAAASQAELDRRLSELRQELSVLNMETEVILGTGGAPGHNPSLDALALGTGSGLEGPAKQEAPQLVTGLSPLVLSLLSQNQRTPSPLSMAAKAGTPAVQTAVDMQSKPEMQAMAGMEAETSSAQAGKAAKSEMTGVKPMDEGAMPPKPEVKSINPTGYSANPMLQAKSSYRAELYEDCLLILKDEKGPEADHLRSRCLTRLDRWDEAIENLDRIIKLDPNSSLGKRAIEDKKFAEWMKSANDRIKKDTADKAGN